MFREKKGRLKSLSPVAGAASGAVEAGDVFGLESLMTNSVGSAHDIGMTVTLKPQCPLCPRCMCVPRQQADGGWD